ncbi:hypothetical protein LXL04_035383 [Taraxacum kok-saghyz]
MHLQSRPPSGFLFTGDYTIFRRESDDQGTQVEATTSLQRLLPPCSSTVTIISHRDRVVVARECCLRGRSRPGSSRIRERTSFATKSIGAKPIITTSGHQSPPSASPTTTTVVVSRAPVFCYILVTWNLFKLGCNHILT